MQSSESRLYTFSPNTIEKLRKFRLGTSRAKEPQAVICMSVVSIKSISTAGISCARRLYNNAQLLHVQIRSTNRRWKYLKPTTRSTIQWRV